MATDGGNKSNFFQVCRISNQTLKTCLNSNYRLCRPMKRPLTQHSKQVVNTHTIHVIHGHSLSSSQTTANLLSCYYGLKQCITAYFQGLSSATLSYHCLT